MPPGVRRAARVIVLAGIAVLATAAVAHAGNGGLAPPDPKSPNAQRITDAYWVIVVFTGFIFVLVEGALIAFIVKYRRGRRDRTAEGPQIHGSGRLEVAWTVLPVVILAAIGTFVFYKLPGIKDVPEASAADQTTVEIEGHQFYWLFRYPNGAVAIDKMRAPADDVVRERITSPDDGVIHSWWVPQLGGKYDAIPGKVNETWFQAPAGRYEYRCAELCGIQHAYMNGYVDGAAAGGVPAMGRAARAERDERRARQGGVGRRLRRSATASTASTSGPRCAGTRCSPTGRVSRRSSGTAGT